MNQSILSRGKDVIEAVDIGLEILKTDRNQVSIEIVQHEKKGFLKLGTQPAIVKITKIESNEPLQNQKDAAPDENQTGRKLSLIHEMEKAINELHVEEIEMNERKNRDDDDLDKTEEEQTAGKVWVRDGILYGKPSAFQYPTITPGKHVKIYKNQEPVTETTLVTGSDRFEIKTEEETKETKWHITCDSHYLNVTLHVEPGMKKYYKVVDQDPDTHLVIESEEIIDIQNELEYKVILGELERLKVVHGFNHAEIMKAIHAEEQGDFIIASGTKPKEGKHGVYELLVNTSRMKGPQQRSDGTMDFREVQIIPTVNKGQVIAVIHPPIPGIPGVSVSNTPIPPEPTYPLIVQAGKGTALIEEGNKVVATETGRPMVEQRGLLAKFSIIPKLVHYSDVDITSGNIRFKGDVDILGNIEEGMVVEADGHINILHNANKAIVSSKNSIILQKNSIGSTLSAGKHNIFESEMINLLAIILEEFKKLLNSIHHLLLLPAFKMTDFQKKGLYPVIKLLLEQKFKTIIPPTKQLIEVCTQGSHVLGLEWMTIAEQLKLSLLSSITNEYHSMHRLEELAERMELLIEKHKNLNDDDCQISMMYAINSTIYSGGNVSIHGQGCYNSKIHAGGMLVVSGVLRGGEVYARKGVSIKEAGSDGGAVTKIMVPANKKILIDLANEGTVIQIGKVKYTFQELQKNITAFLDEKGKLCF
ncbi:flagellar assembly protein A [Bacillus sp. ISL-55]|uniref:flagellar assembly protein A n=1 Tax=Bacillus sp. ISL-55 TaxID=2819134 RepID=UPI001BEACCB2|nr:flagellar assembly protein A [Bacillus sp. ISL-55]MBT2693623.1 FapA family protein [Bacillus sp. ISL-55]